MEPIHFIDEPITIYFETPPCPLVYLQPGEIQGHIVVCLPCFTARLGGNLP